jgi:23S rRNA pseudouridine1911/1915/1917 synthase
MPGAPITDHLPPPSLPRRTHQIRVHLAAAGYPIVGDVLYGADPARWPLFHRSSRLTADPAVPRILLHSRRITFLALVRHATLDAEAPLPPDMQSYVRAASSVLRDF